MTTLKGEITRIANDKIAIKEALEEKGVTVGDVSLDEYADLVRSIQTGGSGEGGDGTEYGTIYTTEFPDGKPLAVGDFDKLYGDDQSYLKPPIEFSFGTVARDSIVKYSFGKNKTSIGDYFLYYCENLETVEGMEQIIDSIGNSFLSSTSINHPIILNDDITTIGDYFLSGASKFNSLLKLPNNLQSLGSGLLNGASIFNQPLVFPNSLTSINNILVGAQAFNSPIALPASLEELDNFLSHVPNFNQPIALPNGLKSIGSFFLNYASKFNQPLVIPPSVTSIGNEFLNNATSFNSLLILPENLTSIGANFMCTTSKFNQPLTIPASVTSIGNRFMFMDNTSGGEVFVGPLTWNPPVPTSGDKTYWLASWNSGGSMNTTGVTVTGANAQALINACPDSTRLPYRKLILG